MDKELLPLCTENMSLGQSILFSLEYSPLPPSDLTGDIFIFLAETISLAHLTSIPWPRTGGDFVLVSLGFSPQCFSEADDEGITSPVF